MQTSSTISDQTPTAHESWQTQAVSVRHLAAVFWINVLLWWTERLPKIAKLTAWLFTKAAWAFSPSLRSTTTANSKWLLGSDSTPAQRRRLAKRIVQNFITFICEVSVYGSMSVQQLRDQIEQVDGLEHYEAARKLGKGLIVATAHIGSFEVGVADLREREDRVHVVFQRDRLAGFEKIRQRLHRRLGVIEAPVEDGFAVWLRLRDALQNDEVVLVQADRVMPGQKGTLVPFCGGHIEMPLGPWKLARLSGSPILPVFTTRQANGKMRVVIEPLVEVDKSPPDRSDEPPEAILKLAAVIEKHVLANPEQWLVLYRAWHEDRMGAKG